MSVSSRSVLACAALFLVAGCELDDGDEPSRQNFPADGRSLFVDVASDAGLGFSHHAGIRGEYLLPEIVGPGVAFLDYDDDGDLDVYAVQGGDLRGQRSDDLANRLFRNELSESGHLRFVDVTHSAGVGDVGYGMGIATGDYDNDGDSDFYLTNFASNVLYRNDGNGRFTDVTDAAGVDDPRWSTSATFVDVDGDGWLDLFVTNYVADSVSANRACETPAGLLDYCSPTVYPATSDSLFRNLGDGRFEDVSVASGVASAKGAGLGVVATDLDGDGRTDLYVANDQSANFLWINQGDGSMREAGLTSGSAYNGHGLAEASMGVTAGDYDRDGDDDLFMTHMNNQTNTLYSNAGDGSFVDVTDQVGLGAASKIFTGFGARWFDFDNDGWLDLFIANGAVLMEPSRAPASDFPYEQRNQLFRNGGGDRFVEIRDASLESLNVSRGAAFGDVDNDGDVDVLVANANGPLELLINQHDGREDWLGLVMGPDARAQGARVLIQRTGVAAPWRHIRTDGSYLAANDHRIHVGLGGGSEAVDVGVVWPDGTRERWRNVSRGAYLKLEQGSGEGWSEAAAHGVDP